MIPERLSFSLSLQIGLDHARVKMRQRGTAVKSTHAQETPTKTLGSDGL